ncbi:MAG: GIY-YIG nuclease family protein [Candidatus Binatia bacterium]
MTDERSERTTFAQLIAEGALEIGDGYRAKNEELGGDGLIFLRAGHVTDTHIDFEGVERFHSQLESRVRSKIAKPGDTVITTKGNSTGRTTFVSPSMPLFIYSPHLSYWRSLHPSRIEGGFLRYWCKSSEFISQLAGMKASTDMAPYLSLIDQKRLEISLPPIGRQRAIAHILGTLDDKIELNRRTNETLEAMARALFKSWFVDFLPVRAKMAAANQAPYVSTLPAAEKGKWFVYALECEDGSVYIGQTEDLRQRWQQHYSGKGGRWTKGHPPIRVVHWEALPSRGKSVEREKWLKTGYGRKWLKEQIAATSACTQTGDPVRAKSECRDPGLPKHIADLFPDRFENSELGEIPAGWEVGKVGELASLSRNGINPGDFPAETFEHFSIPAFDEGQTPKPELGGAIKSNKYLITPNAVLLSKLNPRIPRLWLPVVRNNPRAVCSTEFLVVSPRAEASREFIYGFLSSEMFADVFETLVTGTSGSHQRVKPEGLLSMNVVIPGKSVIHHFSKVVQPLLARMDRAREESQTLAALRDALLPKLMSGELRIDTPQKVAEVSA